MVTAILFILLFGLAQRMNCDSDVVYKLKNIICSTEPKYSTNASCRVKAINWNRSEAKMDVDLVRPMRNISVRFQILKKDYTNQYQPFLIDVQINMCSILARQNFSPYGIILKRVTSKFTNFNHSCPFEGHIIARNIYLDQEVLPNNFPLGFYKLNITVYEVYSMNMEYAGHIIWFIQAMKPIKISKKPK
ncbi:uncharacterized protein [Drosophila tropicalis]|uniref:uncharacterized protein n=1 Tax=Drosophila tropicalis TaxID=46794 RepID=UPI0035ABF9D4